MIKWKLKDYLDVHDLTPYKLAQVSGLAKNTVYGMARGEAEGNLKTLETVIKTLRELTGERVELGDVLEVIDDEPVTEYESAQALDAESHVWLEADLTPPLEPYEWGETDPNTLGKPVRYVAGVGIVVVGEDE